MLLMFYYTYDRLNIFWALLCPSPGAHYYSADYHMGHPVLGLLLVGSQVQVGWISDRAAGYRLQQGLSSTETFTFLVSVLKLERKVQGDITLFL